MARPRRLQPHPDTPACPAPFHGDDNAYANASPPCRCPDAREAWRLRCKRSRGGRLAPALVPAVGAVRRLRALMAAGHTVADIAAAASVSQWQLAVVAQGVRAQSVTRETDAAVRRAYAALSGSRGPSRITAARARKAGWPLPEEWLPDELDDPAADPRPADPDGPRFAHELVEIAALGMATRDQLATMTPAERSAAVAALSDLPIPAVADRLGCSERTVHRIRRQQATEATTHQLDDVA